MALCSLTTRRVDLPDEPGAWVELRPLSAKLLHTIGLEAAKVGRAALAEDEFDVSAEGYEETTLLLSQAIVAWSYDVPVSRETVEDIDLITTAFLKGELMGGNAEIPLPSGALSTESSAETQE